MTVPDILAPLDFARADRERIDRIRKQMREQDKLKHADPTVEEGAERIYIIFAKKPRGRTWKMVTWKRGRMSVRRLRNLRKRARYAKRIGGPDALLRAIDVRLLRRAGLPKLAPLPIGKAPKSPNRPQLGEKAPRRPNRGVGGGRHKPKAQIATSRAIYGQNRPIVKAPKGRRQLVGVRGLRPRKCAAKTKKRTPCPTRAQWKTSFTNASGRRIVRDYCRKHAWDDTLLPDGAKQVVRVRRDILVTQ